MKLVVVPMEVVRVDNTRCPSGTRVKRLGNPALDNYDSDFLQVCLQQNQRTLRCSSLHSAITKRSLEENEVVVGPFYLMDDQPGIEKVTFLDSDKSITIHTPSAVQEEALDKRQMFNLQIFRVHLKPLTISTFF